MARRSSVAPLALATFVAMLANSLLVPAFPQIAEGLGLTVQETGGLVTAYVLAYGILTPVFGVLADRVGRRRVLVPCLVAFGVGGALPLLTASFPLIVAGRVLQGAGGAGILPVALAWVADAADGAEARDRATGALSVAFAVGETSAPAIGGLLAVLGWRWPFAAYLLALPAAALVALRVPEAPISRRTTFRAYAAGGARVLKSGPLLALYATFFLFASAYFGLFTLFPAYAAGAWGAGSGRTGLLLLAFGIGWALSSLAFSRFEGVPRARLLVGGLSTQAIALAVLVLTRSEPLAAPLLAAWGAGAGAVVTALFAMVPARADEEHRGVVTSLLSSTGFLGLGSGPIVVPLLAPTGFEAAARVGVGFLAVAAILALTVAIADARRGAAASASASAL